MLVELGLVEQRYQAVLAVLNDGALVTDVARRTGVSRQTVHEWLVRYANHGLAGLA
ncbi:MAG: helix-turn-helix domain-containing protein, partial [Actinomycetota bacterium]|nr:helix-turn-helix domain-containing protein [Actinomycetota bacterium]